MATCSPLRIKRKQKVSEGCEDIRLDSSGFEKCMQCGRCTASCPAAFHYDDFRPRDIMRSLSLGQTEALLKGPGIWRCGQCYSCHARCPRDNSVGAAVLALRQESIRRGLASQEIAGLARKIRENLYSCGETFLPSTLSVDPAEFGVKTFERTAENLKKRVKLGFLKDDARVERIPDGAMEEIRYIMRSTGFTEADDEK
jgi:heterodisulfide reductase subunit C1